MQFVARKVEPNNTNISKCDETFSKTRAENFTKWADKLNLVQKTSAEIEKVSSFPARSCTYIYICINWVMFSINGDAADPFIEDEWKMRASVARHDRHACSMATGRLVSGQFRCDAYMNKKYIIDHALLNVSVNAF